MSLPDCDPELWEHGEHIATIVNLTPAEIEKIVKAAAKESGQRMDWHYVGGRACVRMLGDIQKGCEALAKIFADRPEPICRFTTPQDSVIPMSALRGGGEEKPDA